MLADRGCYCCCWVTEALSACAEHDGCLVTPQHCAWPGCARTREVHQLLGRGGSVTIRGLAC